MVDFVKEINNLRNSVFQMASGLFFFNLFID